MNILETVKDTLTTATSTVSNFFNEETSITRKNFAILCALFALIGIVYGFLIAPIKKGIYVNVSNNGNCANDMEDDD